jgi:Bacterial TSP3 repeat
MSEKMSKIFGVILFITVGVSAIFLGIKQYTRKINDPFAVSAAAVADLKNQINAANPTVDKTKDTDGDGLSDYDEINIYHTSPYLKDTDSDGIPDGVEVKNGTDPNCPQGKTCTAPLPTNTQIPDDNEPDFNTLANESENLNDLINETQDAQAAQDASEPNTNTTAPAAPSAAEIRSLLINDGLDEQSLEGISDQDLVDLYNESLSETAAQSANANSNNAP